MKVDMPKRAQTRAGSFSSSEKEASTGRSVSPKIKNIFTRPYTAPRAVKAGSFGE